MVSAASSLNNFGHPATQDGGDKANALLDREHHARFNAKAMENITFPFLGLPVELQVEVVNKISLYCDLRALCLTSKEVSSIATPRLYYMVDLTRAMVSVSGMGEERQLLSRIYSLLRGPANLNFIRVLKTDERFQRKSTALMDRLMPLLREDFLIEFSYSTESIYCFPTPSQLQSLWGRQKNLRNLRLYSHMVPWLVGFLNKSEPTETASLLKSFAKLDIVRSWDDMTLSGTVLCWPLENLDLCLLQNLSIDGRGIPGRILLTLIDLFAGGFFTNLRKLSLCSIYFIRTLILTNVPSLRSLVMIDCNSTGISLLEFPDKFQLGSLSICECGEVESVTLLLAQIKGLEQLTITTDEELYVVDETIIDLTSAIISHKDTLRVFETDLGIEAEVSAPQWESYFVEKIQLCDKLVNLCLPLVSNQPTSYYRKLIANFPSLSILVIFTGFGSCSEWSPGRALKIFPASTKLESVLFKDPGRDLVSYFHQRRFVREELERLCFLSKRGEITAKDMEAWRFRAGGRRV